MCFQINWYQTLKILWKQVNEFPNAFNKTVVLSNCFRQATLVCILHWAEFILLLYTNIVHITILEMSQKQIKIPLFETFRQEITLKVLDFVFQDFNKQ